MPLIKYCDIDFQHSIFTLGETLQIPVVAIDRPGYGGSTAYPDPKVKNEELERRGTTFVQEQGKYLNCSTSSVERVWIWCIQYGSIGTFDRGMITIVAAAELKEYPLAGLVVSGIGCKSHMHESPDSSHRNGGYSRENSGSDQIDEQQTHIRFSPKVKDRLMLNFPPKANEVLLVDPKVTSYTEVLQTRFPWSYWCSYSQRVTMPFLYAVGDQDGFWDSSEEGTMQFTELFRTKSPKVENAVISMAPHCMEMSLQGTAWLLRCLGFAIECTMGQGKKD
ncbi:hypothetical protein BDV33DRAFT_191525 [Aspergillus novoparasiticus]|uniref:Alpha/Beta hydrolase protein n=1 Tax=Aspergillus novoparasiticus TaxID=986946 RepID=A0A5N6ERQ8_9EURO|nr:hypothetical protein BDV33DRAFT_191525 [Aspergillus novoparasiticus]